MPNSAIINFKRPLILVTASPARRELLTKTGLKFAVNSVDIDESMKDNEDVFEYVKRLAEAKSDAFSYPFNDAVIITVDTAIELDGEIIGKPKNEKHAREILKRLSGKTHDVVSAITIRNAQTKTIKTELTKTQITFDILTDEMLDWYISTLEWKSRAGAYAIQGKGSALINEVNGCFTNVIGISIPSLLQLLSNVK